MAGNHTNAYVTSQPSRFSIADSIVQQDQLNMARQDQKRREQQLEEQRKDKLYERDEKLRERLLKIPQNYDTGSGSLNELQGRIIMQAVNRKGEIYNQLRSGKLSDSERIKLELENQTLDNLPANLKVATNNFTKMIGDYDKGVADGSLFRNLDFEGKVKNGFDNYIGGFDENGFPLIGFKDVNGDGKMDLMAWDNLKDGIGVWDFQPKLGYEKMINEMSKGLGTVKTKTREGYDEITIKGIPLNVAQTSAKSMMYDPDGGLTSFAKSRLTELGYDYKNANKETIESIEKDVTERLLNSKDRENLKERDTASEQGALNRAQRERHHQDGKVKTDTKTGVGEAVDPSKATWGNHYKHLANGVKSVPVTGKVTIDAINRVVDSVEIKKDDKGKEVRVNKKDNKTYSNVTINNYSYDKNGNMVVSGTYPEGKTTKSLIGVNMWSDDKVTVSENRKLNITVSKETESRIAQMLGQTTSELKQRANYTAKNIKSELPDLDKKISDLPDLPNE